MLSIKPGSLPDQALLRQYSRTGAYTDCFHTEIDRVVTQADYVSAFYTTWLFKAERTILKWAVSRPSSDAEAIQLANGDVEQFAAWYVEGRRDDQLLLSDYRDRTRSWLMVAPSESGDAGKTRLYFGSAVVPKPGKKSGAASMGWGFYMLIGFHKVYSVLLLKAARSRLENLALADP